MRPTVNTLIPFAATLTLLFSGTPAAAHIQVAPTTAAPDDAVKFEFLVPNERPQSTLKIPAGVIPFSFEVTPGWERTTAMDSTGAIDKVRWSGRLASDGFVRFSMLASTPPSDGTIQWKAIQRYSDGKESAWIGGADSESPAPTTAITPTAAKANAGGETSSGSPTATTAKGSESDGGDQSFGLAALALAGVSLLIAALALAVSLRRRH
ncbi:MAG: DUF1775 domain-containing protein [Solirubrobacterales bacterium]|nr:DUF1775 domain-containing protein [Solirubrobacterales bacterium]